ncbi:MAG: hypothetical protein IT291_01595, partial [Deltaproteobacteria bacterium]|nr:hypothetical protein [Deltaproteobacteria bacterium]
TAMSPLSATVWECERLRCNLCGEVHTAKAPRGVGVKKYDETASSMVGLLKYGAGLPFNRIPGETRNAVSLFLIIRIYPHGSTLFPVAESQGLGEFLVIPYCQSA